MLAESRPRLTAWHFASALRTRLASLLWHWPVLLGLGCCAGVLMQVGDFVTDDAAITLRYARQLADGHGLSWNAGDKPVEGYTNFAHVLLGWAAIEAGLPPLTSLRLVNQACLLLICVLVYALVLARTRDRWPAAAAGVLIGVHAPLAYWASSGLETALYVASSYAAILAATSPRWQRTLWPALWFLIAALSRLDGPIVCATVVAALAAAALHARSLRPLKTAAPWIAAFTLGYACYFAWRFQTFGYLFSNSTYFKLGADGQAHLVRQFASENLLLLLLVLGAPWRKLGVLGVIALALIGAHLAIYANVRESVAYYHRFFLPVVPALVILATASLARLWRAGTSWRSGAVLLFALALGFDLWQPETSARAIARDVPRLNSRIATRARVAAYLVNHADAKATVAIEDVGVVGFVLPNPIIDLFGLNDAEFTHAFGLKSREYVAARMQQQPEFVVVVSRNREQLRAFYAAGRYATRSKSLFRERYALAAVIASPLENYHYFVYGRQSYAAVEPAQRVEFRARHDLAGGVDDLFTQVRAARAR